MKLARNLMVLVLVGGLGCGLVAVAAGCDKDDEDKAPTAKPADKPATKLCDKPRAKEVKQPGTNLYWLRYSIGQRLLGSSCQGMAEQMSWDGAMIACPKGYRLPTREEFMSLLGGCDADARGGRNGHCNECAKSSMCSSMFGEDIEWYWSSSSYATNSYYAWVVSFVTGSVIYSDKGLDKYVRCARSGQEKKAAAAEENARREKHAKSKDVKQPGTKLYWLRCPLGQRWTGSSCTGKAKEIKWKKAMIACPKDYRLPTREEFVSLLGGCDADVPGGKIGYCNDCAKSSRCSSMFGEDRSYYWSSSSYAPAPSVAWVVGFGTGSVSGGVKDDGRVVRCARSGP